MTRIYCLMRLARKLGLSLSLIGVGYLLGNAFPTFEVVPYGFKRAENYIKPGKEADKLTIGCAPNCKDFNDELQE